MSRWSVVFCTLAMLAAPISVYGVASKLGWLHALGCFAAGANVMFVLHRLVDSRDR